jgi:voltage-gated potassium channel
MATRRIGNCSRALQRLPTLPVMSRVERWERRAEIPLLLLALAFLVAYAWPVVDPDVDSDLAAVLHAATWTVWGAFGIDLVARLYLAEDRLSYARRHWYDVALLLLPLLRQLRLLRLLAIARIFNRITTNSLVGRVGFHVLGTAMMAALLAAIAMLDVEQDAADANITTLGDALWWSATTVTTVGYGDRYPVTTAGRLIAVALMVVGIATVGAIIATVTGWVVAQVEAEAAEHEG